MLKDQFYPIYTFSRQSLISFRSTEISPSSVAQRTKIEDTRQAPYQKARFAIPPFRDDRVARGAIKRTR